MIEYKKDLEVGDFLEEINRATERANIIFPTLGLNFSRQWFREDNGTYNTIEYLVGTVLKDLHKDKKPSNCATGGLKVEMWIDDVGYVNTSIDFELLL